MFLSRRWLVAAVYLYAGIFVPLPAPEGWQTFREIGFTLHLPQGWRELSRTEFAELPAELGSTPQHAFQLGSTYVTIRANEQGKAYLAGADILAAQADELRREIESPRHGGDPEMLSFQERPLFDTLGQRLWWRMLVQSAPHQPVRRIYAAVILTEEGSVRIEALTRLQDDFDDTFNGLVTSFELDQNLRYHAPKMRLADFTVGFPRLAKSPALHPSEKTVLFLSAALIGLWILGTLVFNVLALLDFFLLKGRLKAAAIRWLQRTPIVRLREAPSALRAHPTRLRRLPLRWSFAWLVLLSFLLGFWLAPLYLQNPALYRGVFLASCWTMGYGLVALAVGLHYLPNSSRRLKYEIMAAAFATFSVPGTLADPMAQMSIVGQGGGYIGGFFQGNMLSQALYFGLAGPVLFLVLRSGGSVAERRAAFLHRLLYRYAILPPLLISLAPMIPIGVLFSFGYVFLVARYVVGEKTRENPFLYLRSYHDRNTALALGKIVMPVAWKFGPVLATAHALQPPQELYSKTNFATAAQLRELPDTGWRDWIQAILPHCRGVIIDVTVASEGLLWELERALETLPPERIVVLVHEDLPTDLLPADVRTIRFGLGWRARWAARKALRVWLKTLRSAPPRLPHQLGVATG